MRVLVAVVLVGCSGVESVDDRSLTRTAQIPLTLDPSSAHPAHRLTWRYVDAEGKPVAEATIDDPRIVRSEFDEKGEADPQFAVDPTIPLVVTLPNVRGELLVEDEAGHRLATKLAIESASEFHTRRDALATNADVLGPPVEIAARSENGPTVLIVPEGFTEAQQVEFNALANGVAATIRHHPSLGGRGNRVRVLRQNVRSQQSGTDPSPAINSVNTAFDSRLSHDNIARCLFLPESGRAFAEGLRQAARADVIVVIANTTTWGGCANSGLLVTASSVGLTVEQRRERDLVVFHEVGHALFGLGDEYSVSDGQSCSGSSWPNVGFRASIWGLTFVALPWSSQVPAGTPVPTATPTGTNDEYASFAPRMVGGFEGAGYCLRGRFRPSPQCGMRQFHHRFCPVCERHIASVFESRFPVTPPMPSCDGICTYGVCGPCDAGGWETTCLNWNGCGGALQIP